MGDQGGGVVAGELVEARGLAAHHVEKVTGGEITPAMCVCPAALDFTGPKRLKIA